MKIGPGTARIAAQWRYPVKSMRGEEVDQARISLAGMKGDRAYAILDAEDGKVASAKNPRKWPIMFDCAARYIKQPDDVTPGTVEIDLGDGRTTTSADSGLDETFSSLFRRPVRFAAQPPTQPQFECDISEAEGTSSETEIVTVDMPKGTFFDSCVLHMLTTATLRHLESLYPEGSFDVRRFRPNLVIEAGEDQPGFVENAWIGHTLVVGDEVRLKVVEPCTRCIMTTLPQGDLPKDAGILRTVARHNSSAVGVRMAVLQGGTVKRGDPVRVE